jgi:hypothetical protein
MGHEAFSEKLPQSSRLHKHLRYKIKRKMMIDGTGCVIVDGKPIMEARDTRRISG